MVMCFYKPGHTLSISEKEGAMSESEALSHWKNVNRQLFAEPISLALKLLDRGDRLEIVYPNINGRPASEAYKLVIRRGRKTLKYYLDTRVRSSGKTFVLSFNEERQSGDGTTVTWSIKEKKNKLGWTGSST